MSLPPAAIAAPTWTSTAAIGPMTSSSPTTTGRLRRYRDAGQGNREARRGAPLYRLI
jgi:hypothetical protein